MASSFWGKRVFCLITGASRGLGKAITTGVAEKLKDGKALILLVSRDEKKLEEVKSAVVSNNIDVYIASRDLSKPSVSDFVDIIQSALKSYNYKADDFDQLLLVHNAGSVGDITKLASDFRDLTELQSYLDLNLHSVMLLTTAFLEVFNEQVNKGRRIILNISSLMAKEAFKGFTQYCIGKAARVMYFKVLALENPSVRILNYSPGPLETDMAGEIQDHGPLEIQEYFKTIRAKGQLLKCETTVKKLISILEKDEYQSGDHIDVFDRV